MSLSPGSPALSLNLGSRARTDSCDDINSCRTLFDIVWGCLATIFACTWVSIHPNVPSPNQSAVNLFWRRLRLMLIAIIAPELMVTFALVQRSTAAYFSREFGVSRTHGFFLCMGGFVSHSSRHPIALEYQIREPYLAMIRETKIEDIMNGSKGDTLSKGVALCQTLWFLIQCLARVTQHIPVTQLEVATLAFAVLNIFTWLLWWDKPLDVQQPIVLLVAREEPLSPRNSEPWRGDFLDQFLGAIMPGYYPDFEPGSCTAVPTFWANADNARPEFGVGLIMECLVGVLFGCIHCAAWNAHFSSDIEKWMWRSSALAVAALPLVLSLLFMWIAVIILVMGVVAVAELEATNIRRKTPIPKILVVVVPIYLVARLFLIMLPFTALRHLPPAVFMDVDWTVYIPHL
ncbi:hypothetical protein C8F01DRAFT_1300934 [Mycena amicta]|nr:hypothetical protein C8F01DRAFT_1300934 [Mycena amicta]